MVKSIKRNYIFSLINTISGILFPLITFPYASRIMEADGIGKVAFFTSIISYISLFTSLGIPIYAVREIAKFRDNAIQMNKTAVEILLLHTFLTIIGYIVVAIMCVTVYKVSIDVPLFIILSLSIFFTAIGCEWFYQGVEDFQYIAIRGLIVRIIYLILLFSLVRSKSDILLYAGLTVMGTVGNNVFNFLRLRKYVTLPFRALRPLQIKRHVKPTVKIFALNLVISLYVNLDTVLLGFLKNDYAVGYYAGASKVARLIISLIQSLQTIMIPRFSFLAQNGDMKSFYELSQKVVDYVVTISIPMSIGLLVMSPSLIHMFCGVTYEPAILTLEIISPIVVIISLSGIAGLQILYPLGHETLVIWATATGAVINLIVCFLLIPSMAENGAAIAVLLGETGVTVSMFIYGRQYIKLNKYSTHYSNCVVGGLFMGGVLFYIRGLGLVDWQNMLIMPLIGIMSYGFYLYLRKDSFFQYIVEIIKRKRVN